MEAISARFSISGFVVVVAVGFFFFFWSFRLCVSGSMSFPPSLSLVYLIPFGFWDTSAALDERVDIMSGTGAC